MTNAKESSVSEKVPFWLDPKKRAIFFQFCSVCAVGLIAYYLVSNTIVNLQRQSIATGFSFLKKEAAFEIGESLIPYSAANAYARALLVGALNTIKVSLQIVNDDSGDDYWRGFHNWLMAKIASVYIEVMRIFHPPSAPFWYAIF
jgi:general L-amino acid transport system permease protein